MILRTRCARGRFAGILTLCLTGVLFAALLSGCGEEKAKKRESSGEETTPAVTTEVTVTETPAPTETPGPTEGPAPTEEPTPTEGPSPTPTPQFFKDAEELVTFLKENENGPEEGKEDDFYWEAGRLSDGLLCGVLMNITSGTPAHSAMLQPTVPEELVNDSIPGYLGSMTMIDTGAAGLMKVCFAVTDEALWKIPDETFKPTVYALNETTQTLYEFSTTVEGNAAYIYTTYTGTFVLLDKVAYEKGLEKTGVKDVDYSLDSGADSNNDGITDFITRLCCDGVLRTGTGACIFRGHTYDEVQSSDDIDGDGVKNGDEYSLRLSVKIPEDATEYGGRYYKRYDTGYIWDDVEALCESYGGHLLTITDEAERDFIKEFLAGGSKSCYWLGATDVEEEGNFRWVTGEPWEFTDWAPLEPNNDGAEDYVEIETWSNYRWNDGEREGDFGQFSKDNHGFVCEWEQDVVAISGRIWVENVSYGNQ
jgi:hypothetical protein